MQVNNMEQKWPILYKMRSPRPVFTRQLPTNPPAHSGFQVGCVYDNTGMPQIISQKGYAPIIIHNTCEQ